MRLVNRDEQGSRHRRDRGTHLAVKVGQLAPPSRDLNGVHHNLSLPQGGESRDVVSVTEPLVHEGRIANSGTGTFVIHDGHVGRHGQGVAFIEHDESAIFKVKVAL